MSIDEYIETVAETHGANGFAVFPDGEVVYGAYRGGDYDLATTDGTITDADGDLTTPEYLADRGTLLAHRDDHGREQYDLVEVDPDSGAVTAHLDDDFRNIHARPSPVNDDVVAFLSNRDRSIDLYTLDLRTGDVDRHSTADATVRGYAWAPDGDHIVYQAGLIDGTAIRVVDLDTGIDDVLVDESDSEQSLAYAGSGRNAWSEDGIIFTTNHETGFRELAVADPDGSFEIVYADERDKYDPQWTPNGDIVFVETRGGNRSVCRLSDGDATTIEQTGMNTAVVARNDGVYYTHDDTSTQGDVYRDGTCVVDEGRVDVQTTEPEEVTYESSDGLEIAARRYDPDGDPVGAVVKPHGGPPSQHFNRLDSIAQVLAHAGFVVLAPDFRGSTGYGREFRKRSDADLGGGDLRDVVAAADYLRDDGHDSVGITGVSYGGYLTLMGIGATDAFDAGASVCGVVNWTTTVENAQEYLGDYGIRKLGGTPEERPEFYEERSPISYVDDIDVPLLLVQGANDPRVPQSEAEQLVDSMDDRGVPFQYLCFEDEGHNLSRTENRVEAGTRIVSFFESHLGS